MAKVLPIGAYSPAVISHNMAPLLPVQAVDRLRRGSPKKVAIDGVEGPAASKPRFAVNGPAALPTALRAPTGLSSLVPRDVRTLGALEALEMSWTMRAKRGLLHTPAGGPPHSRGPISNAVLESYTKLGRNRGKANGKGRSARSTAQTDGEGTFFEGDTSVTAVSRVRGASRSALAEDARSQQGSALAEQPSLAPRAEFTNAPEVGNMGPAGDSVMAGAQSLRSQVLNIRDEMAAQTQSLVDDAKLARRLSMVNARFA